MTGLAHTSKTESEEVGGTRLSVGEQWEPGINSTCLVGRPSWRGEVVLGLQRAGGLAEEKVGSWGDLGLSQIRPNGMGWAEKES